MKINKTKHIIALIAILFLLLIIGAFIFSSIQHHMNKDNREAMLEIFEKSNVGMGFDEFLRIYVDNKSYYLKINKDEDEYRISMPLEFGASDWVLIANTKDNKITELKIRTLDGPKPSKSPKDKK